MIQGRLKCNMSLRNSDQVQVFDCRTEGIMGLDHIALILENLLMDLNYNIWIDLRRSSPYGLIRYNQWKCGVGDGFMWLTSHLPKISQQVRPRKRQKAKPCGGLLEGFAILDDVYNAKSEWAMGLDAVGVFCKYTFVSLILWMIYIMMAHHQYWNTGIMNVHGHTIILILNLGQVMVLTLIMMGLVNLNRWVRCEGCRSWLILGELTSLGFNTSMYHILVRQIIRS